MNDTIKGIILSQNEYREKDLMIKMLCPDYPVLTFIIKGANQSKSKRAGASLPGSLVEIIFDDVVDTTMFQAKSLSLIKSTTHLYDDLYVLNSFQMIAEMIIKLNIEENIFDDLSYILAHITKDNCFVFLTIFMSHCLECLGLKPYVDGCVMCEDTKVVYISIEDGGFVCANCVESRNDVSIDLMRKFRIANKAQLTDVQSILEKIQYNPKDVAFFVEFLEFHTGIKLKSFELLASLAGVV